MSIFDSKSKLFYKECHLAGAKYHDLDEVFDKLHVGQEVYLERDRNNHYDPNAIGVVYREVDDDGMVEEYLMGYIPRTENEPLADFLDMGWGKAFKCTIVQINPEAYYEHQVRLKISIVRNEDLGQ